MLGSLKTVVKDLVIWHLEAFSVYFFAFSSIIAPLLGIVLLLGLLYSPFWLLGLLYLLWFYYDLRTPEKGSRPNPNNRKWSLYKYMASYFPVKLVKTAELSPEHNYIIGAHPHGVLCFGPFLSLCTDAANFDECFPGIQCTIAAIQGMFWFPIRREQILAMSNLIAVNKESIDYYLSQSPRGRALGIVVGGANEIIEAHPNTYRVCLANRRGFVKAAIRNGSFSAYLVPMYNFGENNLYRQLPNQPGSFVRKLQDSIKNLLTYPLTIAFGRGLYLRFFGSGSMPQRSPITCVVGRPIPVTRNPNPSRCEVEELHSEYCKQLVELFEEHKLKYGARPSDHLTIF